MNKWFSRFQLGWSFGDPAVNFQGCNLSDLFIIYILGYMNPPRVHYITRVFIHMIAFLGDSGINLHFPLGAKSSGTVNGKPSEYCWNCSKEYSLRIISLWLQASWPSLHFCPTTVYSTLNTIWLYMVHFMSYIAKHCPMYTTWNVFFWFFKATSVVDLLFPGSPHDGIPW